MGTRGQVKRSLELPEAYTSGSRPALNPALLPAASPSAHQHIRSSATSIRTQCICNAGSRLVAGTAASLPWAPALQPSPARHECMLNPPARPHLPDSIPAKHIHPLPHQHGRVPFPA